jgi:hypothetical protein
MKLNSQFKLAILRPVALIVLACLAVFPQTQKKVVEWSKFPFGSGKENVGPDIQLLRQIDGIELEEVKVGDKTIIMGGPFAGDVDWIRDLTFRVKNISNEQIMGIQITLNLPEMYRSPEVPFIGGCRHDKNQKCLMPGDEVELRMPRGGLYDWLKGVVVKEGGEVSMIDKVRIREMIVTLPNGMQLVSGCIKTTDTKNACAHPKR